MAASSARVPRVRSTAPSTPALVRMWRPIITFSMADRLANRRIFWKVRARPAKATSCGFLPDMDSPLKVQLPSSGMYRPVSTLNSVVLPAPFGPISP
ncbi:hypothetical protein G6F50_016244 [Rhizopus delemar]|uniref:Uncharacterized protein n=1 Tax=Rhizopus delemar TaxID=936053 RepID=A0A9P7C249_9FUNG|nr:hypothetical protein G6F50_016244 [Rhizopus delemar]